MGPYEILGPIGAGGMGEVWKARDTRLQRVVAIKQLKGVHSARFEQEARAIAALNHPHVCQIFDVGPDYLVLEGNQDLPPLADALEEAKKVSSLFPRSVLLGGRQATLMELRDRIEDAEIFHFAGHGFGGEGGGLILRGAAGAPALLRAAEIKDLHLSNCRLAVLSGCSTGAGERNGPGDPRSLVSAFLHAKTGEVVASFWNLNSAASQMLIDHLYSAILSGASTEQSLRAAAAVVRSQPGYQHPYYWAGLQVFSLH